MNQKITIGDYILMRLKEFNVDHVFGVPGDYNLGFLDQIVNYKGIEWIGTCNELNGAYAADGYSRVRGLGALVTTFGVGELSAINGIAGAYAERIPIVAITGAPALSVQKKHKLVHHTLGDGNFKHFLKMFKEITVAQLLITANTKPSEIDKIFYACWLYKRPVYISLPSDVSYVKISAPTKPLILKYPPSNIKKVSMICTQIAKCLEKAKSPIAVIDFCAVHYDMRDEILGFLNSTGIPYASFSLAKGALDESHPQYIGNYEGPTTSKIMYEQFLKSDCVISFGLQLSDFNTGGAKSPIRNKVSFEIHSCFCILQNKIHQKIYFVDLIPALIKKLKNYHYDDQIINPTPIPIFSPTKERIRQARFWQCMGHVFNTNYIILGDAGTSSFGCLNIPIFQNTLLIIQALWASIGYSVGAVLGTCLADLNRRSVLFIGDGSFQLTAQEVSTILRHKLKPIIFLINNDGYTVERLIHGPKMLYNDIQMWNYTEIVKVFGGTDSQTHIVKTERELNNVLKICVADNNFHFIEVIMDRNDAPENLRNLTNALAKTNKY